MSSDEAVQATNDDASQCKRCAVQLGYWKDDYIPLFIKGCDRKAPEINRGYFARVKGVEIFVNQFLKLTGNGAQIVNLGAGFDTLFWRLKDSGFNVTNFVDIDFPNVTAKKCNYIKRNTKLLDKINVEDGEIRLSSTDLHSDNYHIISCDLRNLKEVSKKLSEAQINFEIPTLFLAECVLVYIDVNDVTNLLNWITKFFKKALFVNYEQVNMNDKFGTVMLNNLRARNCFLPGVGDCQNLETQMARFKATGWDRSLAWDMVSVYDAIPQQERRRIEKIELLDEQELLVQLFQHYCIAIASKHPMFDGISLTAPA